MERLTLAELARLVIVRYRLPAGERRAWVDRIRKRAMGDVGVGSLTRQGDGTFLLADAANWLRRTHWRGLPPPGSFDDLPGIAASPLERLIIRKGMDKGKARFSVTAHPESAEFKPHLPGTLAACHLEIQRLNDQLTRYYRQRARLLDEVNVLEMEKARRLVRQSAGRKGGLKTQRQKRKSSV